MRECQRPESVSTLTARVAAMIWHSSRRAGRYALALYFLHLDTAHRVSHMQTTDEQKIGRIARCQLLYLLTTAGIRAMGGTGQAENAVCFGCTSPGNRTLLSSPLFIHGRFLRSERNLLQNCAIPCNETRRPNEQNTPHQRYCAMLRKHAQKLFLQL